MKNINRLLCDVKKEVRRANVTATVVTTVIMPRYNSAHETLKQDERVVQAK